MAYFRFRVRGFSMNPFIKNGDIVTISPLFNLSTVFGRPVAFIHHEIDDLIVHRVVGKIGNRYFIKGDSSFKIDGLIPRKDILGVVTKVERQGKKIIFGLGIERFIIAFLNRINLFRFIFRAHRAVFSFVDRHFAIF